MTVGSVDHFMVDAGPAVDMDIKHINAEIGFETIKYSESKHELKQDFVDSTERSRTRSTA